MDLDILLPGPTEPADTWRWATVTATSPLRVRLDGDTTALDVTPDTLTAGLAVGARVWCQIVGRRVVVHGQSGGSGWPVRVPSYIAIEDKLTDWWAAVAGTGLAQAVVIGDSISEGTGASTALHRWISQTQALLRARTGRTLGSLWPFIPTDPVTTTPGFPVSRSGTVTFDNARGLGWRSAIIGVDGTVRFDFYGTSFKIPHLKATGTGVMRVVIDEGAATLVDTNSVSNPPGANSAIWASPTLARGEHSVKITRDNTSTTGQNVFIQGLLTYDLDEAAGVRILDASYHGIATSFFTAGRNAQMASAIASAGPVQLVIIAVGTNDYGAGTDPATYKAAILALITAIRAAGFTGSFALVNMYSNVTRTSGYEIYGVKMWEIANSDAKIGYFDLRVRMPDVPNPPSAPEGLGMYADALHPNDKGHEWMGYLFSDYLSVRS